MKKDDLASGVIVPLITPYHFSELAPLIDRVLAGGVKAVVLLGTTGEAPWLAHAQKKTLIRQIVPHFAKKAQVLVGITGKTLVETIELAEITEEAGAFASFLAPRILGADCAKTIEAVLNATSGRLLLYNYPALSEGQHLPLEHISTFFHEERILGIKDSSGDTAYFDILLKHRPKRFKVYFGPETDLDQALKKDIDGFVPGTGNLEPQLACTIWQKKDLGPWSEWYAIKSVVQSKHPDFITAFKLILFERGLISDPRRFP